MARRQSIFLVVLLLVGLPLFPVSSTTQQTFSVRSSTDIASKQPGPGPHYTPSAGLAYAGDPLDSAGDKSRPPVETQKTSVDAEYVIDQLSLGKRLHYFADPNGRLTINDLLKSRDLNWKRSRQTTPTFGFTNSTYWFYVDVANPSSVSIAKIFQVANPLIDDIRVYVAANDRVLDSFHTGLELPFAQRPIRHHDFAFPITIAPREGVRIYISAHTRSDGVRMPASLWGIRAWQSEVQTEYMINGMYYGLLVGLALYNFFLFLVIKDFAYLYYSLFQLTFIVFQLAANGYGYQFLWPEHTGLNTLLSYVFVCLPGMFLCLFTNNILSIKGSSKLINRLWLALAGVFAVGLIVTPFIVSKLYVGLVSLNPVVLAMAVLFAVTAVRYWKLGLVARIWAVALLIFIGGAVLYVLPAIGLIESNVFLTYTVQMGSALEAVLLSFLLGYRIRKEQKDKFELLVQSEEVRQAAVAKSRFLAAASHDLRQPLHALSLFVDVLKEEKDERQRQNLFPRIDASLEALRKLFDALLDISRLDANVVDPEYSHFDVADLLRDLAAEFSAAAAQKGLKLRVHAETSVVVSDRLLLERILRNLLSNAIRYTPSGGVMLSVRQRGDTVLLEVWDTGIGIAREHQDEVFNEFHQLDSAHHDRNQGLGLGLAIVKRLCRLLNHPLELRSQPGKGSVFRVRVPMGSRSLVASKEAARVLHGQELSGYRILVIDDEREILDAMQALLSKWGCEVMVADSLEDAQRQLDATNEIPDLIVSDLRLSHDLTGVEAVSRLRERIGAAIPAILVTGESVAAQLELAKRSGYDILQKPVRPLRLRSAIHHHLLTTGPERSTGE